MRKKILYVEDEADQVAVVTARLNVAGYDVISAASGGEGIIKAGSEKPDLILLDVMLPDIEGFEICQHLKRSPDTGKIPIIIITASGRKEIVKKFLDLGADDFIRKPFGSEELVTKIKDLLKEWRH